MSIGSKGSMSGTVSTGHLSRQIYADEHGHWFTCDKYQNRQYLAPWDMRDCVDFERRMGKKVRVRVKARRGPERRA